MPVAASTWPGRFPDSDMVRDTWWQIPRNAYGTNRGCGHHPSERGVLGLANDNEMGWVIDVETSECSQTWWP